MQAKHVKWNGDVREAHSLGKNRPQQEVPVTKTMGPCASAQEISVFIFFPLESPDCKSSDVATFLRGPNSHHLATELLASDFLKLPLVTVEPIEHFCPSRKR